MRKETWKNTSYPNSKPCWQKHRIKVKTEKTQLERVLAGIDWNKLAIIGKEK